MRVKHTVECIKANYDEESQTLMLFCHFPAFNEKRLIYFNKNDFNFHGGPVPDAEMHKTAKLWEGKPFIFQMEDSLDNPSLSDKEEFAHEKVYLGDIGAKMVKNIENVLEEDLLEVARKRLLSSQGESNEGSSDN